MKAILVPLASDASYRSLMETDAPISDIEEKPYRSVLQTALLLARSLDGYIEGFPLGPEIPDLYGMEAPLVLPAVLDQNWRREVVARSRQALYDFMRSNGVPERREEPSCLSFGWSGDNLRGDSFIGDYGRAFDVIVVAQPGDGPRQATLEEALFHSGRAVLVAPPSPPSTMGSNVVVAWNGSTETARTISFAMPLLIKADRVTVLTVRDATVPGPTGEQIARTLRINGVPAHPLTLDSDGLVPGEVVLFHAREVGGDLLIKGAYTHSRLRQMIFGGTTRYLLDHATVPMLMAH
jgi:nucleotide-binding universal stress UspA family protein